MRAFDQNCMLFAFVGVHTQIFVKSETNECSFTEFFTFRVKDNDLFAGLGCGHFLSVSHPLSLVIGAFWNSGGLLVGLNVYRTVA